jgi:hypothetical protein
VDSARRVIVGGAKGDRLDGRKGLSQRNNTTPLVFRQHSAGIYMYELV